MTKRRKVKSNLPDVQKTQFVKVILAVTVGIMSMLCFAEAVQAQVIEVWPTGVFDLDREHVKNAINLGDTVLLHATNKDGKPTIFNIEDIWINKDVTIMGERLSSSVEFKTPIGSIFSDRTVVFCPYGYGKGGKYAFAVDGEAVVIEDLRFDSFFSTAIYVGGCSSDGIAIRNNVITQLLKPKGDFGILISGYADRIKGIITIENNEIDNVKQTAIYARRTADLEISNNTLSYAQDCVDVRGTANLEITGNTINNVQGRGIWAGKAANLYIADNAINNANTCIDVRDISDGTVTNNTVNGEMQRGIYFKNASNSTISNNLISRVISPLWHKWWNGAIAIDLGNNNIVQNNEIIGEGRSAIHLYRTHNNTILDNDCSGYTGRWSDPYQTWNVCQFWDSSFSSGNTISGNIWGPISPESRLATVVISERFGASPSDDNILDNDYRQYNDVPGWTGENPDGPGCILLTEGTENNFVFESGHFPRDTDAKSQVMDLGINNRVVGHDTDDVISPGIGQRLKQILAEINDLPDEEVQEQEEGEGIGLEELQ